MTNELITKQDILDIVTDLVSDFLFYDRKEDEECALGAIEKCVADGVLTIEDLVEQFEAQLYFCMDNKKDDDET